MSQAQSVADKPSVVAWIVRYVLPMIECALPGSEAIRGMPELSR
jgi:hypothetical protein